MRLLPLALLLLPACAISLSRPGIPIAQRENPADQRQTSPDGSLLPSLEACAPLVLTNPRPAAGQASPIPPDPAKGDTTALATRNRALCGVVRQAN